MQLLLRGFGREGELKNGEYSDFERGG